jgi:hypothetical protein
MDIRNSPVTSPPVKRKVLRNSLTQSLPAQRVMGPQPARETAVTAAHVSNGAGVLDGCIDLEPVAHDARIRQQASAVALVIVRHPVHVETAVGAAEPVALFQHQLPAQPGLVDFQQQPLEQQTLVLERKAVLTVVVGAVDRVADGKVAVAGHGASPP